MANILQEILILFIEVLCCTIFVDSFYEPVFLKGKIISKMSRQILMVTAAFIMVGLFNEHIIIKIIGLMLGYAIILKLYNKQTIIKNFIICLIFQCLPLIIDYIAIAIYTINVPDENMLTYTQVLLVVLSRTVLFICIVTIRSVVDKRTIEYLEDSQWIKLLIFPVFTLIITTIMVYNSERIVEGRLENLFWIVAFGLIGMDIFVFYFIMEIAKKNRILKENELISLQSQNQLALYKKVQEDNERQKRMSHEYKNQIESMWALLEAGNISELKEYMTKLTGNIRNDMDYINTNNAVVNAVINNKYQEAVKKNIVFIFSINDLSTISLKPDDIVTIFANLLDNAIEACDKCDRKIIKLKTVYENDELVITVKNSYNGIINIENGNIITTKEDFGNHGIGLKNIIQAVENNNGDYVIDYSDDEFNVSIIIPQ
ncbi:MAG: sensor histidine kinase [Lachnospiraceae bacterium]|nr:sensor histidine kinase [Lachnospiraceae bacterium]